MSQRAKANRPGDLGRHRGILGSKPSRWRSWMACGLTVSAFGIGFSTAQGQMPIPPAGQQPPNAINFPERPNKLPDSKAQPPDGKQPDLVLPPPKPLDPPPAGLPRVGPRERPLGYTPRPNASTADKIQRYFNNFIDTEATMELIIGRTRLLNLKESPIRIQIDDDGIVEYNFLSKDQIALQGRALGVTTIRMWFTNTNEATKTDILSYYVRVLPDPEEKERVQRAYKQLQDEINCAFPDSVICLHLVGEKVIVTGHAKDMAEVTQILKIIRANGQTPGGRSRASHIPTDRQASGRDPNNPSEPAASPAVGGLEEYIVDGTNNIVNMIKIAGEQTVSMRVTIAEVNRTAARSAGMNFTLIDNKGNPYFASNAGLIAAGGQAGSNGQVGIAAAAAGGSLASCIPLCPGLPAGAGGFNNLPFAVDNGQVRFAVSALRDLDYAKLLAEPIVTTINGQTANFRAGGQFPTPILASSGNAGSTLEGVQFQNYGVDVSFTPYITDRDRIRLVLNADITALDIQQGSSNIGGANIPFLKQRSVNTTVEMREGQTLAVAGLINNNYTGDAHRVPLFGDIPFVGNLFGFNRVSAGEQELLILVQPQLVHPIDCRDQIPLPGHDLYEPTDFEFYLLGRIESHRTTNFRSPVRTDIHRIKQYQQMESNYIAGPSGYSETCGERR
jgi:pilus assembly protein CpaC